ncbi:2866_t:CDS:2 [Cetraspora pellucida]|uniref:2866_t:CDS:1 n=1 Tax=Cetraspora pellucida TaxID=1433469 RepID=A0A9N9CZ73_9GLOM|nr:2866_t:CDS:2 [Cetraspora pellucida]
MIYEDADENMARNAVRALQQERERNDTAISILHEFVDFFNPTVKIPTRRTISTKILVKYAEKLEQTKVSTLSELQEPVTIMFDGWKNVHCQEILGAIILSTTNQLYIWDAEDISNQSQKTLDVLNTIHTFFEHASNQNLNIVVMITDSTSAYASPIKDAIEIVSYFTDQRHSKTILFIHDEQQRIYKTIYSFVLPSYSILHQYSFKPSDKFKTAINNPQFWTYLDELRDAANFFNVTYEFGYIVQQYEDETNEFSFMMMQKLEKRWADWEQLLLLLVVIFHPQYHLQALSNTNFFSLERITQWIEYYYEVWFNIKPKHVALELTEYYMKRGIFSDKRFKNTLEAISKENMTINNATGFVLLRYWEFAAIDQKEIGKIALHLFSIKVNSAPCEHLFSRMEWFQNQRCSHPKLPTIFRMTQITAEMAWEEHLNNTKKVRQSVAANHITHSTNSETNDPSTLNPIVVENEMPSNDNYDSNDVCDDYNSDDNANDEYEILSDETITREWVNEESEKLEELNTVSSDMHKYHPAKHKDSKIELQYLFTCTLS